MKATFITLVVLAAAVAVLGVVFPAHRAPPAIWPFVVVLIAAGAKYIWSQPATAAAPEGWLTYVGLSLALSLVLIGADILVFGVRRLHLVFDLAVGGMSFLIGWAFRLRSWVLSRHNRAGKSPQ